MTALFIAAFTGQWLESGDHIPALTGLLATLICRVVFGPGRFLIPAMVFITAVLTLLRGRLDLPAGEEAEGAAGAENGGFSGESQVLTEQAAAGIPETEEVGA